MRFRPPNTSPPYLSRKDQFRMLRLVGLLLLVVLAIRYAGKPSSWYWLTGPPQQETSNQTSAERSQPSLEEVDFGARLDEEDPLQPDEFRSKHPATNGTSSQKKNGSSVITDNSHHAEKRGAAKEKKKDGQEKAAQEQSHNLSISPDLLDVVEDNTLGIRNDEAQAYYQILFKIRDLPERKIQRAAGHHTSLAVLMVESDYYRGKLVTVEGEIRRLVPRSVQSNSQGISQIYEAWLFSDDSGNNPYRIDCLHIPSRMPQGEMLDEGVKVRATGYFFKRYSYASQGGLHTAPLILAKSLHWLRPGKTKEQAPPQLIPYILGFVILVGTSLGFTLWRFSVNDKRFHERHMKRLLAAPDENIEALNDIEATDVEQMLGQLSEQSRSRSEDSEPGTEELDQNSS